MFSKSSMRHTAPHSIAACDSFRYVLLSVNDAGGDQWRDQWGLMDTGSADRWGRWSGSQRAQKPLLTAIPSVAMED